MYRVLIVDDNHSFVDSLMVMLRDLPLQFDYAFRLREAEEKIQRYKSYINHSSLKQVIDFKNKINDWSNQNEMNGSTEQLPRPIAPILTEKPLNNEGFGLIIVEQNVETSIKGLQFIQNSIRLNKNLTPKEFILLCSNASDIESDAKMAGITVLEKPIRQQLVRQFVQQRIKQLDQLVSEINEMFDSSDISMSEFESKPKEKKAKSKITSDRKKATPKKTVVAKTPQTTKKINSKNKTVKSNSAKTKKSIA